jgi:hypothetical protein
MFRRRMVSRSECCWPFVSENALVHGQNYARFATISVKVRTAFTILILSVVLAGCYCLVAYWIVNLAAGK